jgi:putative nucleotidyltransferase with HDIG domain
MRALAGGLAGIAAQAVLAGHDSIGRVLLAVGAAAGVEALVDATLGAVVVALRGTGSLGGFLRSMRSLLFATVPLYATVVAILVYGFQSISVWSVILFAAPAFAAHRIYGLYRQEQDARRQLAESNLTLERANLSFATALVTTLDARDRYTAGHSAAVAVYARDIAGELGLDVEQQQLAYLCGLVHDIGKIGLPAGLLEKPGPLTPEERRQMQTHSEIGERILAKVADYAEIASIVRHHHERVDGHGYPDRLTDDRIPLISRIIAVADAYNAMTSDRPYRAAMASEHARQRLVDGAGTQFDPPIVEAFEAILAGATDTYREGSRTDFTLVARPAVSSLTEAA